MVRLGCLFPSPKVDVQASPLESLPKAICQTIGMRSGSRQVVVDDIVGKGKGASFAVIAYGCVPRSRSVESAKSGHDVNTRSSRADGEVEDPWL